MLTLQERKDRSNETTIRKCMKIRFSLATIEELQKRIVKPSPAGETALLKKAFQKCTAELQT